MTHPRAVVASALNRRGVCNDSRPRVGQAAFTLIEAVIVMAIIGVVAAVAVPKYANSLVRYRADSAVCRIIRDLDYARSSARDRSTAQAVQFYLSSNSYTLPGINDLKNSGADFTVDLSEEPYRVSIQDLQLGGDGKVIFDGFGQPDSGGSITIRIGAVAKVIVLDADCSEAKLGS